MKNETTFKAYRHSGNKPEGQVFIVKHQNGCDDESIYHDDFDSYMAWGGGFPVGSDKELSIHEGLKAFDGLESFDMSNDFERILKEAREYAAAKPSAESDVKVWSETVWYVKSPTRKRMDFETEVAARQFATELAEHDRILDIQKEVKGRFSETTIRAILKAAEKVGK